STRRRADSQASLSHRPAGLKAAAGGHLARLARASTNDSPEVPFWLICRHFIPTWGAIRGGLCAIVPQTNPPPRTEVECTWTPGRSRVIGGPLATDISSSQTKAAAKG